MADVLGGNAVRGKNVKIPVKEGDGFAYPSEQWWLPGFSLALSPVGWPSVVLQAVRHGEYLLMRELSRQAVSGASSCREDASALAAALAESEARAFACSVQIRFVEHRLGGYHDYQTIHA